MRPQVLLATAFAISVTGRVIEARQGGRPPTTRPQPVPAPTQTGNLGKCGLDSFEGHTAEANRYCSSLLKSGTATLTSTYTASDTTTIQTTIYTTLYPPTTRPTPTTTPTPTIPITTPTPTPTSGCGIVGYTKDTAAYYFDSSGTKNTFAACSAACKADTQCKSFGYGEANCMLFTVDATSNTNYNPMSPYTFYDTSCPKELPVRAAAKRQITISLGISDPAKLSSACSCYIGTGPAGVTKTTSVTVTSKTTAISTVTRTVSLLLKNKVQKY
ncbi:hypothetical protein P280DRAFT_506227 [Massarina eburnea CBS 473.64]|uniref:Apple domain-containing protein n=1 Tax=Massarina eburnea CBS 473.64 TaxID=1395130 RepID=A0A6A6S1D0_9PLEO|nr:hypothetical protein P280DRAFT_506227 [Massarina eburnea CBS 473.64]